MTTTSRRRALIIGVGKFGGNDNDFDDLPFAEDLADQVDDALRKYRAGDFSTQVQKNPNREEISDAVRDVLDDERLDARIVHVVSHGRFGKQADRVEVVGSCGRAGANNVREWVSSSQDLGIPTLFLIDLCGAGRASDLKFLVEPYEEELNAWVLAGARSDELAFEGAFTRAAVHVLLQCGEDGLGTDPRLPFVSLREFARRISDGLRGQSLWTTTVPLHYEAYLPILPNPLYRKDPIADEVARLDPPLQPFLTDAVADAAHFQGRAGAFFTGRQAALDELVPWLEDDGKGGLMIVTGAAGSGKSAILGAIVCAAHPALQRLAGHVRRRMADPPNPNGSLVAIHARQRGLDEIVISIARQLELDAPPEGWTAAALIGAISRLPVSPVLIVDALDECSEASAVQVLLLVPLATARNAEGRAIARLVVGTRPWLDQFSPLLTIAEKSRHLIDLDVVDGEQLYRDLRRYLLDSLHGLLHDEWIASGLARRLASDHVQRRGVSAAKRWGHFLIASRFARYIIDNPPRQEADIEALLDRVPVELPQLLEMELAAHPRPAHLRAALAALAYAKGDGMPLELLRKIVSSVGPADPQLFTGDDVRLYLRRTDGEDGVSLLRLYHQGLADYLREYPITPLERHDLTGPVLAALLETRDVKGRRSWEHAPTYLRRHAIEHAVDAGGVDILLTDSEFLVFADRDRLLGYLGHARSNSARLAAAIYRAAHHLLGPEPMLRRRLLHLTALRFGVGGLNESEMERR
ncbi:caspase family protein [Actinoplanes sp. NPDC049548]|uniref:nSTAND1 domain-containing NTPase n=1 Tax=Actinoplanes sp. NPDC049548 TaxID=3155152 RepID=UPI003436F85C